MFGILHFAYATFRMTTFPRTTALCHSEPTPSRVLCRTRLFGHSRGAKEENKVNRDLWSSVRNLRFSHRLRFFLLAVVRMTSFCNFFPAVKKLPRKVARWLSDIPASRFARRRGLRNSLRSNSPRPISVFSLAPGSPIKAGIFPSQTLPAVKGKGGSLLSFRARAIARQGISMSSRTHVRDLMLLSI